MTSQALRNPMSHKKAVAVRNGSTVLFEQSIDIKLIRSYNIIQIINRIFNVVDEKIWIGFHHAALLGMPVICFFGSIRWANSVSI